MGCAVDRNRAKRLLRDGVRAAESSIVGGFDVILIARPSIVDFKAYEVSAAVEELLSRADLLCEVNG